MNGLGKVLHHLRHLAGGGDGGEWTDGQLLHRFLTRHEEAAFTALVERHGPLVLGVCRRVLGSGPDADDVFQATFLVLFCRAGSIRKTASVGSWLHGVAYRMAQKARTREARRRRHEQEAPGRPGADPGEEAARRELRRLLDAELGRLPDKYRLPLVLCCLEGRTHEEAARQLGWPSGTVSGRLSRAREVLRQRLGRHGLALSAASLAVLLAEEASAGVVPPALATAGLRTANLVAAGATVPPPGLSASVSALAEGILRNMALARLKVAGLLLLAAGLLAGGAALFAGWILGAKPPAERAAANAHPEHRPPVLRDAAGDPLPPGALGRLGAVRFRHSGGVSSVAFAPDGRMVVGAGADGIRLWQVPSGREIRVCGPGYRGVNSLAMSQDGKLLVSGGADNFVRVWDVATGKQLLKVPDKRIWAEAVAISPDNRLIADGSRRGVVRVWETKTGKLLYQWEKEKHVTVVSSLAFSPDGKYLASASWDRSLFLWDLARGKRVRVFRGHNGEVRSVVFSPDGKLLLSTAGYPDGSTRIWEVATGKEVRKVDGTPHGLLAVAVSADGKTFAAGGVAGNLGLWEVSTGRLLHRLNPAGPAWVNAVAFSRDGRTLVSGGGDGLLRLWDVRTGQEIIPPGSNPGPLDALAWSPDGRLLATGGRDGTITLWDPAGKRVARFHGHDQAVTSLAFSPDGRMLASVSRDGTGRVWDPATRKVLVPLVGHQGPVWGAAFTPDGKGLLTGGQDGTARLWDAATGKERNCLLRGQYPVYRVACSPDGKWLAAGTTGGEGSVYLWQADGGKQGRVLYRLVKKSAGIVGLTFAPDDRALAAADSDGIIRQWEPATGREVPPAAGDKKWTWYHNDGWVGSLAYSPDGRTLAAAGSGLRLWERATGRVRLQLQGHRDVINQVAFSPNGLKLASASDDRTVLVWDVAHLRRAGLPLTVPELDAAWSDLASADAARAYSALCRLANAPGRSVPLVRERLRPVAPVAQEKLSRLLADLESNRFAVRRQARAEVARLGELALPALRQALAGRPSAELRRQAERLLKEASVLTGDRLRAVRAVEVLERVGSPEARRVLQTLAGGAPEARLTREARATLERLERRPHFRP